MALYTQYINLNFFSYILCTTFTAWREKQYIDRMCKWIMRNIVKVK